jgi:hypothetical protein
MLDVGKVIALTGRTEEEVVAAANATGTDDIIDVVAYLLDPPPNSGAKYMPQKPVIDDGLSPEVREKLKIARELSDKLNSLHKPIGAPPVAFQKSVPKSSLLELVDHQQVVEDERSAVVTVPVLIPQQMSQETPAQTN